MPASLKQEIDALTAARRDADRRNPGCFWGTCGRTLSYSASPMRIFPASWSGLIWSALDVSAIPLDIWRIDAAPHRRV
jgi:hypothetical protein